MNENKMALIWVPLEKEDISGLERMLETKDVFVVASFESDLSLYAMNSYLETFGAGGPILKALLDRNLFSPVVNQVRGIPIRGDDETAGIAAATMAFLSCARVVVDPSLALYEVGKREGHNFALEELRLFRIAEALDPKAFAHLTFQRAERIPDWVLDSARRKAEIDELPALEFEKPLVEWKRHRLVLTKVAVLQNSSLDGWEKMQDLIQWSIEDGYVDASALFMAAMVFSPRTLGSVMKKVCSEDSHTRSAAVDNASWDLTYLTTWTRYAENSEELWLFCSADRALRDLARASLGMRGARQEILERHWPAKQARILEKQFEELDQLVASRIGRPKPTGRLAQLEAMQADLSARLTAHTKS